MKLAICAVGRAKPSPERELTELYLERARGAGPQIGVGSADLIEVDERKKLEPAELKVREGELLLAAAPKGAIIIALDERGKNLKSSELARVIEGRRDQGAPAMAFLIGGADGLSDAVRQSADLTLSLGKATWPHMLVRAMLAEQLYRAITILTGHPYHREG